MYVRFFVTPSDSVAIIAANAVETIPYFSAGLKGVARFSSYFQVFSFSVSVTHMHTQTSVCLCVQAYKNTCDHVKYSNGRLILVIVYMVAAKGVIICV